MSWAGWENFVPSEKKPPKRHKYGAQSTELGGVTFASKREAKRFAELKLLEKAGEIWDLELQPRFPLVVASTSGQLLQAASALAGTFDGRIGEYRADFAYRSKQGRVVEDAKGFATALYKWKKRHVEKQYGITIVEV